jgi:hypothetical protein
LSQAEGRRAVQGPAAEDWMKVSNRNDEDRGRTGFWSRAGDFPGEGISSRRERLKEMLKARYRISDEEAERRLRRAGLEENEDAADRRGPARRPQPNDASESQARQCAAKPPHGGPRKGS